MFFGLNCKDIILHEPWVSIKGTVVDPRICIQFLFFHVKEYLNRTFKPKKNSVSVVVVAVVESSYFWKEEQSSRPECVCLHLYALWTIGPYLLFALSTTIFQPSPTSPLFASDCQRVSLVFHNYPHYHQSLCLWLTLLFQFSFLSLVTFLRHVCLKAVEKVLLLEEDSFFGRNGLLEFRLEFANFHLFNVGFQFNFVCRGHWSTWWYSIIIQGSDFVVLFLILCCSLHTSQLRQSIVCMWLLGHHPLRGGRP